MKRVLLTGANGFIGRYCTEALLNAGFEVYAACYGACAAMPEQAHCFELDLRDAESVSKCMQELSPSHLLHLAWYVEPATYVHADENIDWLNYSLLLLKAFYASGGERFITVGTCFEYDLSFGTLNENATPLDSDSLYAAAKTSLFRLCSAYCARHSVSYAHARPFYLFGVGESEKRIVPYVMRNLLDGKPVKVSHGEQVRDYLYAADVGAALAAITASEAEGAINIGAGSGIKLKELFAMIGRITGREDLIQLGAVPARVDEPPVIVADNSRLINETGWVQKYSLETGLKAMLTAMRSEIE